MPELVLHVQDIEEAPKDYDFEVTRAWLDEALADTDVRPGSSEPGQLRFRAQKQGEDVVIHGRLRASLVAECARCLEATPLEVDTDFASLRVARAADLRPEPDEVELTPEDLDREFYSGDDIVLDDSVREALLVEVPMRVVCQEDCAGIAVPEHVAGPADLRQAAAAEAGSNGQAVDPRLAPLMKLVGKVPAEES